jgi:signal transduction histidine kinase
MEMTGYSAPLPRVSKELLRHQVAGICSSPVMETLLRTSAGLMLVVNESRQIVAINKAFLESIGIADVEGVLGLRLGETLHCRYAFDKPDGCGTTGYCSSCGAAIAMMTAIDGDRPCERLCALTTGRNGRQQEVCLLVRSQPLIVEGQRWILVYASDVSQQQFWASLEKVFFHDINNMLCSLKNYSEYLHELMPENALIHRQKLIAERLCQEVRMQSRLTQCRSTEVLAVPAETSLRNIRNQVFCIVLVNNAMDGKEIVEEGQYESLVINTDAMLVSRVLINMLLNALEATDRGDRVIFRTLVQRGQVTWQVWNSAVIPENIQLRIFQKYFSTKGETGRGLGSYAMKLFGEECLGGSVGFISAAGTGTTFTFTLPC